MINLIKWFIPFVALGSVNGVKANNASSFGFDFAAGERCFQMNDILYETPQTIEAWVRLGSAEEGEVGGVIIGNHKQFVLTGMNLQINDEHKVSIFWNNELHLTFENYVLPRHKWTHIAVTRADDCSNFKLYINGGLEDEINQRSTKYLDSNMPFLIGCDLSHWKENIETFNGEIRQVTLYSSCLNKAQIYKDYANSGNISYLTRENLLFNTYLKEDSKELLDTSKFANHARLFSRGYFYDGELYEPGDYTFGVTPDPQCIPEARPYDSHYFGDYLLANAAKQKIVLNMCTGDNSNVNNESKVYELELMMKEYERLNGTMMWATVPGNHDYDDQTNTTRNLTKYNSVFSYEKISQYPYFGGSYRVGETQNAYYLFEVSGVKYVLVTLEFGPDDEMLEWANNVVESYPERRAIMLTHALVGGDGLFLDAPMADSPTTHGMAANVQVNDGIDIYNKFIRKHKNMFLCISGHITYDDVVYRQDIGDHGNIITSFLIDQQEVMRGHLDLFSCLMSFDELNQEIRINLASNITRKLFNTQNQFRLSFKGHTDILSDTYYNSDGTLKNEYKNMVRKPITEEIKFVDNIDCSFIWTIAILPLGVSLVLVPYVVKKARGKKHEK